MPDTKHHIAIPLATLLTMLKSEGFDISTATLLDIQKVLADIADEELKNFTELQSILGPIISRNKEDQENFNRIFEQYLTFINQNARNPPVSTRLEINIKRRIKIIAATGILLLFFAWYLFGKSNKPLITFRSETPGQQSLVVNIPVTLRSSVTDTFRKENYVVSWKIDDRIYQNKRSLDLSFGDTGNHLVTVLLVNEKGKQVATHSDTLFIGCEKPPFVSIQKDSSSSQEGITSKKNTYYAQITNPTADTTKYKDKYSWFINDSLASQTSILSTDYKSDAPYIIKVKVDCKYIHCSTDSLTAYLNEMPAYDLAITGAKPLALKAAFQWGNIAFAGLYTLVMPVLLAAFILYFKRRKKSEAREPKKIVEEPTGPYKIEFKKQNDKIAPEKEISQLADTMRKRHISDTRVVNVQKTIQKTIRSGGFPLLHFTPKTQPTDFLVFVDKENADGHQVQLFEYIIKKLQNEQVNITSYNFYKEPLLLSNEKLNHRHLPVDKIAQLYPNTILFIFSNTQAFFQTLNTTLKPWVTEKFKLWQHKIILTPVAINDWDYKESAFLNAGYTVVPADLNAHQLITSEINDLLNRQNRQKLSIPLAYSSRFVNFDDWAELKAYLGNDQELLQWVCALAVYPYVDWKVTVALGKAIEESMGEQNKLVTYSNLLKISRIKWMQTGVQPDALRLKLLNHLNNKIEVVARKTMLQLLDEIEADILESSLIQDEFQLNKTVNSFLLHTQNPVEISLKTSDKENMKKYVENKLLDYPLEKYLNKADKTLLKDQDGGKSISPEEYFRLEDSREINIRRSIAAAAILAGLFLLFRFFSNETNYKAPHQFADVSFNLSSYRNDINPALTTLSVAANDSIYSGERVSDSNFVIKQILIDSTQPALIIVQIQHGNLSFERPIDLKWQAYNLSIVPPASKEPLLIRYNNAASFTNVEAQLNKGLYRYNISATQQDFTDSSRIIYYENNQKSKADSIVEIIKERVGIIVKTEFTEEIRKPPATPILFLNLTNTPPCNIIANNALPNSLHEIWEGETGDRLASIDRGKRVIYYSTGNKNTYDTYRIDEICMSNTGTYKIITTANNQYKVFFFRNITPQSFELSACQDFLDTKEEAISTQEDSCIDYETMGWYFERRGTIIYVPVDARSYTDEGKSGFRRINDYLRNGNQTVNLTLFTNRFFIGKNEIYARKNQVEQRAPIANNIGKVASWKNGSYNGTPFDRDYIQVTYIVKPDCAKVFRSIAAAMKDPDMVCKLNLSGQNLSAVPKEINSFRNLQELDLTSTKIPLKEIVQLEKKFPRWLILYSGTGNYKKIDNISFNARYYPDQRGEVLLDRISRVLRTDGKAKIKLRGGYKNDPEKKNINAYIQNTINRLVEKGVLSIKQIEMELYNNSTEQQATLFIEVLGINFPKNFQFPS